MRLKSVVCAVSLLAGTAALCVAQTASQFTVTEQTKVPGLTLKPGTYSIRVVDHLSDRLIVRVDGTQGDAHSTFLGIQNGKITKPSSSGPVVWTKSPKGGTILRGFEFPGGGSVVEFVYPKAEAVSIATVNDSKVPAIDPASEGKVADKGLSKDDLEVVDALAAVVDDGGTERLEARDCCGEVCRTTEQPGSERRSGTRDGRGECAAGCSCASAEGEAGDCQAAAYSKRDAAGMGCWELFA